MKEHGWSVYLNKNYSVYIETAKILCASQS